MLRRAVFACGDASLGQLGGKPGPFYHLLPTHIAKLPPTKAKTKDAQEHHASLALTCGHFHAAIMDTTVTAEGAMAATLSTFGAAGHGQVIHPPQDASSPSAPFLSQSISSMTSSIQDEPCSSATLQATAGGDMSHARTTPIVAAGRFHTIYGHAPCDGSSLVTLGGSDDTGGTVQFPPHVAPGITAMACGWGHTMLLDAEQRVWAVGYGKDGQLGRPLPVGTDAVCARDVRGEEDAVVDLPQGALAISAGLDHSAAVLTDGSVFTWGLNDHGQTGHNRPDLSRTVVPRRVSGLPNPVVSVACGYAHTVALDGDGRVWAWGRAQEGQLGAGEEWMQSSSRNDDGTPVAWEPVPVLFPAGVRVVAVAAGRVHSLALDAEGHAWSWGFGRHGRLGHGDHDTLPQPEAVELLMDVDVDGEECAASVGVAVTHIACGLDHSVFVVRDRVEQAKH